MSEESIPLVTNQQVELATRGVGRIKEWVAAFMALIKWRVIGLVTFTAMVAAMVAGQQAGHAGPLARLLVAGLLTAAGAAAFNQYFDRDVDATMSRTRARPIPAGKMTPLFALVTGAVLIASGLALSWRLGRIVTLHIGIAAITYILLYTVWLKRRTPWNIVIGGWTGSAPLLAAWAAVAPVGWGAWALAGIIFLWTPPHFWSLAICKEGEYRRAGIPMLPVVAGVEKTVRAIVAGAFLTLAVSLVPVATRDLGWVYLIVALAAGGAFVVSSWRLLRSPTIPVAWKNYKMSSYYLLALFLGMIVDVAVR
ncbi:MAG TPA: heme o synthase [Anaerolineales bacterium]|nr:heme o synthase [Anaerolineales bacterium]HLF00721.1 heme o synthase [Anaerolineales bacterium]